MPVILRTPRAADDLIEIWRYIAADNEVAADKLLDKIESTLSTLSRNPLIGRRRSELAEDLRSAPVGSYVLFYKPLSDGVLLVRVLSGYRDIQPAMLDE